MRAGAARAASVYTPAAHGDEAPANTAGPFAMNPLILALVVVSVGRVLLGVIAVADGATSYQLVQMAIAVEFAAVGLFLWVSSLGDDRTRVFGTILLLCASPWPRDVLESAADAFQPAAELAGRLRPDAFLPAAVWRFARLYPTEAPASDIVMRVGSSTALASSAALGLATLAMGFDGMWFWPVNMAVSSAGLVALASRFRRPVSSHDRRGRILALGFTAAALPIAIHTLLDAFVPAFRIATDPGQPAYAVSALAVVGGIALAPLVSAYAVLVHQALALRLALTAATRRWIARAALGATWLIPAALTAGVVFWLRSDSLSDLMRGWRLAAFVLIVVVWMAGA